MTLLFTVIFVWRRVCAQTEVKCFLRWSAYVGASESTDKYYINYVQYKTKVNENGDPLYNIISSVKRAS